MSPALAVAPVTPLTSATLVRAMLGQLTVMSVGPVPESPEPSLDVEKWARLDSPAAQLAVEVVAWTRTVKTLPGPGEPARSVPAPPQVRLVPAIEHAPLAGLIVQVRPAGRESVMVKPWATPGPLLVAVMV